MNGKRERIAFVSCCTAGKFFEPVKKGMNDAAQMLGVDCDFMGTPGVDIDRQVEIVAEAVENGYDGIAVNMIDDTKFNSVVEKAASKGISVVAFNVDAPESGRIAAVCQHLYDAGISLANHLAGDIPEEAHLLMTMHDEGVAALEERLAGLKEGLKSLNLSLTTIITGNDAVEGAEVIAATLKQHPDIRIVLGSGQSDTEAAGRAIEKYYAGKDYWNAGFDLSSTTLGLIKNGFTKCSIDQQPYIQGFYPVVQLIHKLRFGLDPSDIDAGAAIVDRNNVDQILQLTENSYR